MRRDNSQIIGVADDIKISVIFYYYLDYMMKFKKTGDHISFENA